MDGRAEAGSHINGAHVLKCPHQQAGTHLMVCGLVPEYRLPLPGQPNNPCDKCRLHWEGSQPPNALPSAILDRLPSRGLGDTVAKAMHAVGIEQRPGCGCAERQAALNEMWPY